MTDSGENGAIGIQNNNARNEDEGIILNPNEPNQPSIPSVEEYTKHQITHYPTKAWCPICVKNAAQNIPHKTSLNTRDTEKISMDYMYMTSKPKEHEIVHPILVMKAKI